MLPRRPLRHFVKYVMIGRASECGNIAEIFPAKIIESINALREDVEALRSEVRHMMTLRTMVRHDPDKLCLLYVRVVREGPGYCVDNSRLESLLDCTVWHYVHLTDAPFPSFKVKFSNSDVHFCYSCWRKVWMFYGSEE